MSLLDIIRAGVAVANTVTKPLQATVQFRHFVSSDGEGAKIYDPPIGQPALELRAIVDWRQKQLRTQTGVLSVSRASVAFLDIAALMAATGGEGVSDEDVVVLPDGTTGPILDMSGFIDALTGLPVMTEVFLG